MKIIIVIEDMRQC